MGENIIWGESNAVVFSNSVSLLIIKDISSSFRSSDCVYSYPSFTQVIGAHTEKYADYFDICAAIVGYVPNVGVHVKENRLSTIVIDATELIQNHLLPNMNGDVSNERLGVDSFFPAAGWTCGNLSDGGIPLILGFDQLPSVSTDNLKAFCAAFGTTGAGEGCCFVSITST